MSDSELGEDRENKPAWSYVRPSAGLSKGSKQGLAVTLVVAVGLFMVVFVFGAPPESGRAIFADFLLAAGLSVLGVWGVGGMIELSGTIRDLAVKAGGGIAIIILVVFVFRPFYSSSVNTSFDQVVEISSFGTVEVVLSEYEDEFRMNEKNAIQLVIPSEIRDRVMNFKTEPFGAQARYRANWDLLRQSNPRIQILEKLEREQSCLSFEETDGKVIVSLSGELEEHAINGEDRTVFTCKN